MEITDAAILTVIPVEFQAVQKILKIDLAKRHRLDGAIFFPTTVYSRLLQRDLRIVVGCIGEASQANASAMAAQMIAGFDPALMILLGIAAGMRGKVKIGDVVVPREVADLSVEVQKGGKSLPRPQIKPWPFAVKQMMPGFLLNREEFRKRLRELFGVPIIPPTEEEEADYADHVTYDPRIVDNTIGSADSLLKDEDAFLQMLKIHEGIRAAEMEAGGFVKACESHLKPRPWLIVRGISDFGDNLKNDDFHRLASCAAATWLQCFLEEGFDLFSLRPEIDQSLSVQDSINETTSTSAQTTSSNIGQLAPLTMEFVNTQIERLATACSTDRLRDVEHIREAWRVGEGAAVLDRVQAMKAREDWRLITPTAQSQILRFEASMQLAIHQDVDAAKRLMREAANLDPSANSETLETLIIYHAISSSEALAHLKSPITQDGWNLRLALLVENEEFALALDELDCPPKELALNAESRRVRAIALLSLGQIHEARKEITKALIDHPNWYNLRLTSAIISYFSSLSIPLLLRTSKNWPAPCDLGLVRKDSAALEELRYAEETFEDLLKRKIVDDDARRELQGWRLACLANDVERQTLARSYCAEILASDPTHPTVLAWAAARDLVTDLKSSADLLFSQLFPQL